MKFAALQIIFTLPVYVVINVFIGDISEWYELSSLTVVASMISGAWVKVIAPNIN